MHVAAYDSAMGTIVLEAFRAARVRGRRIDREAHA
jgi:hypothetical protein